MTFCFAACVLACTLQLHSRERVINTELAIPIPIGIPAVSNEPCDVPAHVSATLAVFAASESAQNEDLNGDGDVQDESIIHVYEFRNARLTNTGLLGWPIAASEQLAVFLVSEQQEERDLDGNGTIDRDGVLHVYDAVRHEVINLRVRVWSGSVQVSDERVVFADLSHYDAPWDEEFQRWVGGFQLWEFDARNGRTRRIELNGHVRAVNGHLALLSGSESRSGRDLNGDGDETDEYVLHVTDLQKPELSRLDLEARFVAAASDFWILAADEEPNATDFNGDGDMSDARQAIVYRLGSEETIPTGVSLIQVTPQEARVEKGPVLLRGESPDGGEVTSWFIYRDADMSTTLVTTEVVPCNSSVSVRCSASLCAFTVQEWCRQVDLNGDGDFHDEAVNVTNLEDGVTTIAAFRSGFRVVDDRVILFVGESDGHDLNGDGDTTDRVLHVYSQDDDTLNSSLAVFSHFNAIGGLKLQLPDGADQGANDVFAFFVDESSQSADLNADGDSTDVVLHFLDLESLEIRNAGISVMFGSIDNIDGFCQHTVRHADGSLAFYVSEQDEGQDLNGDNDAVDFVLHLVSSLEPSSSRFRRGDCNDDGDVNVADAGCSLNWLFGGTAAPDCLATLNMNGDSEINTVDPLFLLNFLFADGPRLSAPFPDCGAGTLPADDELGCVTFEGCE